MSPTIHALVPFVHVADVERSIAFYTQLGATVRRTMDDASGRPHWAFLDIGQTSLMLSRADGPVDHTVQAVLFYTYSRDVAGLRARLIQAGLTVGPIRHPGHMPAGECRVDDPDGYCVLIGQLS